MYCLLLYSGKCIQSLSVTAVHIVLLALYRIHIVLFFVCLILHSSMVSSNLERMVSLMVLLIRELTNCVSVTDVEVVFVNTYRSVFHLL